MQKSRKVREKMYKQKERRKNRKRKGEKQKIKNINDNYR